MALFIATLLVLVFARDVTRAAHDVPAAQASSNQSFAALANALVGEENQIDASLTTVLGHHDGLTRAQLFTSLTMLRNTIASIPAQAQQLRSPMIVDGLNTKLATWAVDRAQAYEAVIKQVATALSLPWPRGRLLSLASADRILASTTREWNQRNGALLSLPGSSSLNPFTNFSGLLGVADISRQLALSPRLTLHRSISIAAVAIAPAPFPAPPGQLEFVATNSISLGVSVLNGSFSSQPVTLDAVLTSTTGHVITMQRQGVLGPNDAFAFAGLNFAVRPGEHATLRLRVLGAPATRGKSVDRTYQVVIAP